MATRAPTDFSSDSPDLLPRNAIVAADADNTFDDQQFVLDRNEMVLADNFSVLRTAYVTTWRTFRSYYVRAPHMCGTSATVACQYSLLCWSDDAADFDIGIYHNGTSTRYSQTITASHTSRIWRPWDAITLYGDGTVNELWIQLDNSVTSPSTPYLYLMGVAIFTNY